uniref:Uncharacterized protein n=1 Tax=Steinernema glaseri TaxID=37863 RepID=A0A1I8ARK3_9BILA
MSPFQLGVIYRKKEGIVGDNAECLLQFNQICEMVFDFRARVGVSSHTTSAFANVGFRGVSDTVHQSFAVALFLIVSASACSVGCLKLPLTFP